MCSAHMGVTCSAHMGVTARCWPMTEGSLFAHHDPSVSRIGGADARATEQHTVLFCPTSQGRTKFKNTVPDAFSRTSCAAVFFRYTRGMIVLGIDTSCDDTGVGIVGDGRVQANVIASQALHRAFGGIMPELASREHLTSIDRVLEMALEESGLTQIGRAHV